jgi:hypothetical protein
MLEGLGNSYRPRGRGALPHDEDPTQGQLRTAPPPGYQAGQPLAEGKPSDGLWYGGHPHKKQRQRVSDADLGS